MRYVKVILSLSIISILSLDGCTTRLDNRRDHEKNGHEFFNEGKYEDALQEWQAALKYTDRSSAPFSGTDRQRIQFNIGTALWNLKRYDKAMESYEQSFLAIPSNTETIKRMISSYEQLGRDDLAGKYKRTLSILNAVQNATKKVEFKIINMPRDTDQEWAAYWKAGAELDTWKSDTFLEADELVLAQYYAHLANESRQEARRWLSGPETSFMQELSKELAIANCQLSYQRAIAAGANLGPMQC